MGKIITIAILLFSSLSFAQDRSIKTVSIEKTSLVGNVFCVQKAGNDCKALEGGSLEKVNIVATENYAGFSKNKINEFIENVLYDLKLALPSNFVWLHNSIV